MMSNFYLGLADQTAGFNANARTAFAEEGTPKKVLFVCPRRNFMQETAEDVSEISFSEMLKQENVAQIKRYVQTHRLNPSEEYQMIVTLAMAVDDDSIAEKIICGYIRRFGLSSCHGKEVLESLGYEKALETLKKAAKEDDETAFEQASVEEKLQDGFHLMHHEDAADVPLAVYVYLTAESQA